jgi:hypothetical protein
VSCPRITGDNAITLSSERPEPVNRTPFLLDISIDVNQLFHPIKIG